MTGRMKWAPLVIFILLGSSLTYGLAKPESSTIKSKMVGVSVPSFTLPAAVPAMPGLSSSDLANGKPHLVNVFASWCVPCMAEAPQLKRIAEAGVPVVGIAVRDRPENLQRFLTRNGNPFRAIGADDDGLCRGIDAQQRGGHLSQMHGIARGHVAVCRHGVRWGSQIELRELARQLARDGHARIDDREAIADHVADR